MRTVIACMMLTASAHAQCGPFGCGDQAALGYFYPPMVARHSVVVVTRIPAAGGHEWRSRSDKPDELYLYRGDVQVGGWKQSERAYRAYDAIRDEYSAIRQAAAPVALPGETPLPSTPLPSKGSDDSGPNYGLDLDKLRSRSDGYWAAGRQVSRAEAIELFGADLPADADALRVTWVGDEATGERIRADLAGLNLRGKVTFQSYAPDASMIRGLGFESGRLHVQAPNGAMLHWQVGHTSAQQLGDVLNAAELRRRDPLFDPNKVPDLTKPKKPSDPNNNPNGGGISIPPPATWPWWIWVGIAVAVLLIMRKPQ